MRKMERLDRQLGRIQDKIRMLELKEEDIYDKLRTERMRLGIKAG